MLYEKIYSLVKGYKYKWKKQDTYVRIKRGLYRTILYGVLG